MKISRLIGLHTGIASLGGLFLAVCLLMSFFKHSENQRRFRLDSIFMKDIERLEESFRQWLIAVDLILGSGETYLIPGARSQSAITDEIIGELRKYPQMKSSLKCLDEVNQCIKSTEVQLDKLEKSTLQPTRQDLMLALEEFDSRSIETLDLLLDTQYKLRQEADINSLHLKETRSRLIIFASVCGIIYITGILLLWLWVTKNLVKPLQNLTSAVDAALLHGKLFQFNESGPAEVRSLSQSVRAFTELLENRVRTRTQELRKRTEMLETEVEERKIAEESAEEAKHKANAATEAKSEFLANMSHELRTPLHGILNFSDFGIEKAISGAREKLLLYFQRIHNNGNTLLLLLNDLLDLAKLESGKMSFNFVATDFGDLITNVIDEFHAVADQRELAIRGHNLEANLNVTIDPERIKQVLRNLLSNALKFSPDGSHIDIRLGQTEEQYRLSIEDQGPGIPGDELELIFAKFEQSSETKSSAGGTGLGLSICKQIIEAHNGRIWAENFPKGGAIFSFEIPILENVKDRQ